MATLWMSLLLVASASWIVSSEYDQEICSIITDSYGLVPPPLPTNFEFKGDHVDSDNKAVIYNELYLDYTNSKGKYMYLLKGIEHHFLFDYEAQQVVHWDVFHPGGDIKEDPLSHMCTTTDLEDSPHRFLFGFMDEYSLRPKMYNSQQMLRFGGKYPYAFNGTARMDQRGLLADMFVGCVYDMEMDATVQTNYTFTSKGVLTSGGTTMEEVTGVESGVLPVPARVSYFGAAYDEESQTYKKFNRTENYYWFKGEPEFEWETFQIPPYVYCDGYRNVYEPPKFPEAFSTRLQVTTITRDELGKMSAQEVTSFEEVEYYKEKNLARRDFTPDPHLDTEIFSKFASYDPVSSIFDFNTGIVYIIHKPTGQCYTRSIIFGDFFETSRKSIFIEMGTPQEVFHMQTDDLEFKGQAHARDIECDVWVGKYFDQNYNATFVKETFFSTNGWHEEADELSEYAVPVKHSIIDADLSGELDENVRTYNFLKFKATPPPLHDFDVSNCIGTVKHKDFAIVLTISNEVKKIIFDYKWDFLESAQYYIASFAQTFTPLRVQRLQLRQMSISDSRPLLLFTLVGKANLRTKTPVGQPGASLEEAVIYLQKFIESNTFAIKFTPRGAKEAVLVTALRGSLYIKTSDGNLEAPTPLKDNDHQRENDFNNYAISQNILFGDSVNDDEDEEKDGMSTGNLTLLALSMLFIGVGIGIAVMYLYVRKMNENSLEDRITLTPQVSTMETPPRSGDAEAAYESPQ